MVYYAISTPKFIKEGAQHMTGTGGLKRVTRDFVEAYQIPLPPIEQQRIIVANIEAERKTLDALKELILGHEKKIEGKIAELWGN